MNGRKFPRAGAPLFEPQDRLVGARLQQMHEPNPGIPKSNVKIAGAEPEGLLLERDYLLYGPGQPLAPAESVQHKCQIAIDREGRLVLGNGLLASMLRTQHLAFDEMDKRAAG